MIGTIGTLTPASVHLTGRSPRLSRATFLSFRPQPRDTPQHRFIRHHQRAALFPGFATLVQARRNTPPKQVRHPTDRQFVSSYSPPRLATTQLPSTTELWLTPTGICTLLIARLHGRTPSARPRATRRQPMALGGSGARRQRVHCSDVPWRQA